MKQKFKGSATILIIIAVLVVVVGLVAWGYLANGKSVGDLTNLNGQTRDEILLKLQKQNSSDEVEAIESDLNDTNLNNIDQGMDQTSSDANRL